MSDLYNVLGLEKNASETDIKKAYRKLAHQWHPDRNSNKEAESRFKEISQAYATLSDPVRRRDYDRGGAPSYNRGPARSQEPNSDTGFGDLFQDIFSTFRRPAPAPQPQDAETKAEISFTESLQGAELSVTVTAPLACPRCQATGSKSQSRPLICPACQGRGSVGDPFFGEVCPSCKGEGTFIEDPCPACKGAGSITQARQLTVKVPPGIKNGSRIRAKGKGGGQPPGDLYVKIRVKGHPVWRWEGRNLIAKIPVSPIEAMQGGVIRVPVPGGEKKVRIPPSPAQNHRLRLKGIGPGGGDILYQLDIQVPTIPPEAEELLEKLAEILPSGEELRKGLWK